MSTSTIISRTFQFNKIFNNDNFNSYRLGTLLLPSSNILLNDIKPIQPITAEPQSLYQRLISKSKINQLCIINNNIYIILHNGLYNINSRNYTYKFNNDNGYGLSISKINNSNDLIAITYENNRIVIININNNEVVFEEVLDFNNVIQTSVEAICNLKPFVINAGYLNGNTITLVLSSCCTEGDTIRPKTLHLITSASISLDNSNYNIGSLYQSNEFFSNITCNASYYSIFSNESWKRCDMDEKVDKIDENENKIEIENTTDSDIKPKFTNNYVVEDPNAQLIKNIEDDEEQEEIEGELVSYFYHTKVFVNSFETSIFPNRVLAYSSDLIGVKNNFDLSIMHLNDWSSVSNFPGLAYVSTGKRHIKWFLISPDSKYCVIVEPNYIYLYFYDKLNPNSGVQEVKKEINIYGIDVNEKGIHILTEEEYKLYPFMN